MLLRPDPWWLDFGQLCLTRSERCLRFKCAVTGFVQPERESLSNGPGVLKLQPVANFPCARDELRSALELAFLPVLEGDRYVIVRLRQRIAQLPRILCRLGGACPTMRPRGKCGITHDADPPEGHGRNQPIKDRLDERFLRAQD